MINCDNIYICNNSSSLLVKRLFLPLFIVDSIGITIGRFVRKTNTKKTGVDGKSHNIFSNEENHTILPDRNKRPIINHLPLLISPSIFGNGSCDFGPSAFGSLTRGTGPTCEWWGSKLGKTHPNLYPSLYMTLLENGPSVQHKSTSCHITRY